MGAFLILLLVASCSGNNSKIIKKACSGKGNKNEVELSDVCVQQLKLTNKKGVPLNGKKFMARLQRIEKKKLKKKKLGKQSSALWKLVKQKLRRVVNQSEVFKKKFSTKSGAAICLIVRAYGQRFGFCTYLFLLIPNKGGRWKKFDELVSEEEKERLRLEKKTIMNENKKKAQAAGRAGKAKKAAQAKKTTQTDTTPKANKTTQTKKTTQGKRATLAKKKATKATQGLQKLNQDAKIMESMRFYLRRKRRCGYFGICVDGCGIFDILCRLKKLLEAAKNAQAKKKNRLLQQKKEEKQKVAKKSKQVSQMKGEMKMEKAQQDEKNKREEEQKANKSDKEGKEQDDKDNKDNDPPAVVVQLDLFKLRCDASEAESLCSEYCCDENRKDSSFCNSQLECY